jgi:type 1 glutamine amidotransferase
MTTPRAESRPLWRRIARILLWLILAIALLLAGVIVYNWDFVQRVFLGGVKVYEMTPPVLPSNIKRPAILVFSKTNGFRHEEAIPAANRLLNQMAKENGWGFYQTENGATFDGATLARFDAVVFNNVSGDVFMPEQKAAFKAFVEGGGGYIGIHAAGDNSHSWDWFVQNLIGAKFIGHPMNPQFQKATVDIEDHGHPATADLPKRWNRVDEWYSFASSPRARGFHVLATLDETSYSPKGLFGSDLAMGKDHPVLWWNCAGQGRLLYSAMGHTAESFAEPLYRRMLLGSLKWTLRLEGTGCGTAARLTPPAGEKP